MNTSATNTMAGNTRKSRLPDYTGVPNGNHNAQAGFAKDLRKRGLRGPWDDEAAGSFAKSSAQKDAIHNAFAGASSIQNANSTTADLDPWTSTAWNSTDTRNNFAFSGNTSPKSRSDASSHDANPLSKYFPGPSTVSQGGPVGTRPTTASTMEASNNAVNFSSGFSDLTQNRDQLLLQDALERNRTMAAMAAQLQGQVQGHEPSALNTIGSGVPRRSVSGRPDTSLHAQTNSFNGLPYHSTHSQRPSLAGSTLSATMGFDQNVGQQNQAQLVDPFGMMGIDSGLNGAGNGLQNAFSHRNGPQGYGHQNFQLNPVSQPWENGQGYGNGLANDIYTNGANLEHRGSMGGRNSPAGSTTYRAGGSLNSPTSFANTPQPNGDAWPRPASRDPLLAAELARRALATPYAQQLPTPLFANSFYPQIPQYQSPYSPYGGPTQHANMGLYGVPIAPHALGAGTVRSRPRNQDPGRAFRSALLHDFKNSKSKPRRLQDIFNHVVEFCGDQSGSRFIQDNLPLANSDEREQLFAEIEPNALQLMKDLFANYVMQKLFEYGDQVQKKVLASIMKGRIVDLSLHPYGCRVVQSALAHVLVEQQVEMVKELEKDIMRISRDQHGNHVVQQIIALVPRQYLDTIMATFKGRVCEMSAHQYACRVVQRMLEHGSDADIDCMMTELYTNVQSLITDMYGNYVIQHVLVHGRPEDRSRIIGLVMPQLLTLSRHKNASNVVEKCIKCGSLQEQRAINKVLAKGDDANGTLFQMLKDQFGNYVIQTLYKSLKDDDQAALKDKLDSLMPALRKSGATSKQIDVIWKLIHPPDESASASSTGARPTPTSTAPASPGLRGDAISAAPTPNLTMDQASLPSTPSSSLPYLNGEVAGDAAVNGAGYLNGQFVGKEGNPDSA